MTPPSRRVTEVKPPDLRTVRDVLALAKAEGHRLYPAMHLAAYTGMRRGEIMGLLWQNVNLLDRYLMVETQLVTANKGIILGPPKTGKGKRRVDLDHTTVEVLIEHRKAQDETREFMRDSYHDQGRVFAGATGDWIHPNLLQRAIRVFGDRAGCPGLNVPVLRHFHASLMLQRGTNIAVVSKRLGHSNVTITANIYSHALPGWQQEAADDFAAAMAESSNIDRMSPKPTARA